MIPELEPDEQVLNESSTLKEGHGQLDWYPIRAGTLVLRIGGMVVEDDSNGLLVSAGVPVGTIDYSNGKIFLNGDLPTAYEVDYYFNSGG